LEDGTPLVASAPHPDAEAETLKLGGGYDTTPISAGLSENAETLKIPPKQPEMTPQDIIMEITDYLRKTVSPGEQTLIKFELLTGLGITVTQISDHFTAAAEKADCEVIDKTETRATVRRKRVYGGMSQRWMPDID
jgi:hypothetical protein